MEPGGGGGPGVRENRPFGELGRGALGPEL